MPAFVQTRKLGDGKAVRHDVRYRKGGRGFKLERAGSFKTGREAKARLQLVEDWLVDGKDPKVELRRLAAGSATRRTVAQLGEDWLATRVDIDWSTRESYRSNLKRLVARFGGDVAEITPADVSAWIVEMVGEPLKPGTVRQNVNLLRQILDTATDLSNPARHRMVKLPKNVRGVKEPPDADDFLALLEAVPMRWRPALVLMEQAGLRVGEAVTLEERDIDRAGCRLRIRPEVSKRDRARWVPIPKWYAAVVEPLQNVDETSLGNTMRHHSARIGIPRIHPHLLRHRRATLWHQSGIVATELAARLGHSKVSESLDTYSHVRPIHEADPSRLLVALGEQVENVVAADVEPTQAGDLLLGDAPHNRLGGRTFYVQLVH